MEEKKRTKAVVEEGTLADDGMDGEVEPTVALVQEVRAGLSVQGRGGRWLIVAAVKVRGF